MAKYYKISKIPPKNKNKNTLVKDWTFGPRQVLDFGAEKYTLKCYQLYEAKIEAFPAQKLPKILISKLTNP